MKEFTFAEDVSNASTLLAKAPPPPIDDSIESNLLSTELENSATLPIPTTEPLMLPVTSKLPLKVILPAVWVIIESPIWSSPSATIILPAVNRLSSPKEPVFIGPYINTAEFATSVELEGLTEIQWFCNESQNNEPVACDEPLSTTEIPPNLTAGESLLRMIVFVPKSTALAVIYCSEDEPCTNKSCVIYIEPVITCVP